MKLKLLHEDDDFVRIHDSFAHYYRRDDELSGLSALVASVTETLYINLLESGYDVIKGTAGPGMAFVRVLRRRGIASKFAVTITIHKDKLPIISVDAGLQGMGIQDKMQINLDDPDAMARLLAFTSSFIVEEDDIEGLLKKYGYEWSTRRMFPGT